jgi:ketosteroid isomerase-like protein
MRKLVIAVVLMCAGSLAAADSPLRAEIESADAAMFAAFNAHDAAKLMSFFADDVEFYHDKDGLVSRDSLAKGFAQLFSRNDGLRRDLVPGSLEVYPIKDFGAIEVAQHRFCHVENGKDDCGTFKFLHVWKKSDAGWKVSRVISYAH